MKDLQSYEFSINMANQGCTSSSKPRSSDFSIARILGTTLDRPSHELSPSPPASPEDCGPFEDREQLQDEQRFEWLQCTRYRPPRLPRSRRREGAQRRKLGRNPRIPFSSAQVSVLEQRFRRSQYLSSADVAELAAFLTLSETRVKIWFQNRRARERRDRETQQRSPASPRSDGVDSPQLGHQQGLNLSLAEARHRGLAETAAALASISRAHGLCSDLTVSSVNALMGSSAFAPVNHLTLMAASSTRQSLAFTAAVVKSGSPGD